MNIKNKNTFILLLICLMLIIGGCSNDSQDTSGNQPAEQPAPVEKTAKGVAEGFGGPVTVELTLVDNIITKLIATGDDETEGIGSRALEELPQIIIDANSLEVDAISGATATSNAILLASEIAINEINGVKSSKTMTPGVYKATGKGYGGPLDVEVEVSEDKILRIDIVNNNETISIGSYAVARLPGKMVEHQIVGVDSISGATVSSNAIKSAVSDALVQANADMTIFSASLPREISKEPTVLEADVVVVGGGLAGLTAAAQASNAGLDVIVLEKLSLTGGCAKPSLGIYTVAQVEENKEYALSDEVETLDDVLQRWKDRQAESLVPNDKFPNYDRLSKMLVESLYTTNWLQTLGVEFERNYALSDGMNGFKVSVDEYEGTGAGQLLQLLEDVVLEAGAEIYTDTRAKELITNDKGDVVGVIADTKTGELQVNADYVILATGGYAASPEMMKSLIPSVPEYNSITSIGNTGDGIKMALEVGGKLLDHQWIHNSRPGYSLNMKSHSQYVIALQHANSPFEDEYETSYARLVVDSEGNRFMNEGASYSEQDINMLKHDKFPYWVIFSNLSPFLDSVVVDAIPSGEAFKADTLEELAQMIGADPETFAKTCARYDELLAKGVDEDYGKSEEFFINPVGTDGPFYALHITPGSNDTLGGIETDYDYAVLDVNGEKINGLYAIGSMSNGHYYNQYYFSGTNLTFATTSGRLAVDSILKELGK